MSEKIQVLVLDDEPIVCKRLKPALEKSGYEVQIFEEPGQALKRIDEKEFDIVVTDIRMEDIDGIQVLEHVLIKSKRTKVIIITGYATRFVHSRFSLVESVTTTIILPERMILLHSCTNRSCPPRSKTEKM